MNRLETEEMILRPYARTVEAHQNSANILIIDDDIDAALVVKSVFAHLGCQTACSSEPEDAMKKICSLKADIIILDWILGDSIDAKSVMDHCELIFKKYSFQINDYNRPKIVTYSSLDRMQIELLRSPFFEHLDHWQKPLPPKELLRRSLSLLEKIGA